jgi:hypothetical protein
VSTREEILLVIKRLLKLPLPDFQVRLAAKTGNAELELARFLPGASHDAAQRRVGAQGLRLHNANRARAARRLITKSWIASHWAE